MEECVIESGIPYTILRSPPHEGYFIKLAMPVTSESLTVQEMYFTPLVPQTLPWPVWPAWTQKTQ